MEGRSGFARGLGLLGVGAAEAADRSHTPSRGSKEETHPAHSLSAIKASRGPA